MEEIQASELSVDTHEADNVRAYFDSGFNRHTFNPLEQPIATDYLKEQVDIWRAAGKTVVFTSGVYDLFHANHRTYLLHTKMAAAPNCWQNMQDGSIVPEWEGLESAERTEFTNQLLDGDSLKLIVSVDGNMAVSQRKGFVPGKGNMERPIYDWRTRARDVLSAGFELSTGNFKPIVDAVTIHDKVEPKLADTPHADIMEIAEFIGPDVWSVFHESEDIIEAAQTTHADRFAGTDIRILNGHEFYHDTLLGGSFKTTSIAKRLGGIAANGNGVA